jgi:hypothetical protein
MNSLNEKGQQGKVQGIPRVVVFREISAMQLKNSFRMGYQIFASHIEEEARDKVVILEDHSILKYFEDVFEDIPRFPMKRDNDSLLIWC